MSWSVTAVGKRDGVKAAIDRACDGYGLGKSRDEFEVARPALKALCDQVPEHVVVSVTASGHSYPASDTAQAGGNISVDIKTLGALAE